MKNYAQNLILPGDSGDRFLVPGRGPNLKPANIWGRGREYQVRDLRAARGAVERHRRRHGPRVPLCSTTFGGSTVPPIFGGGGGGFLQGDIRIGGVGSEYVGPAGGNLVPITLPGVSGVAVGEEIYQVVHSSGTYANPAGWSVVLGGAGVLFDRFRIFRRIADGTAADDFIMPANSLFITGQQWFMQEFIAGATFPDTVFQGGFQNTTATLTWDVSFPGVQPLALTNNTSNDPEALVWGWFACQDRQQPTIPTPSIQDSNPDGLETIVSLAAFAPTGGFSTDTELTLIKFQYLAASKEYVTYSIGRTPGAPSTYGQFTQYFRARLA